MLATQRSVCGAPAQTRRQRLVRSITRPASKHTGKTCALLSFVKQNAVIEYSPSSVESYTVKLTTDAGTAKMVLQDTAGLCARAPAAVTAPHEDGSSKHTRMA